MKKKLLILIIFSFLFLPIYQINAQVEALNPDNDQGVVQDLKDTAGKTGYETYEGIDLIQVRMALAIKVLKYLLIWLGVTFLILIIIAGYQWMTAAGHEEILLNAKKRMKTAVIGLIIVLMAYVFSSFIMSTLSEQTTIQAPGAPPE